MMDQEEMLAVVDDLDADELAELADDLPREEMKDTLIYYMLLLYRLN